MSAWDEAVDVSAHPELFFEDASENLRALQELVGEWQELRSVSTDTADDLEDWIREKFLYDNRLIQHGLSTAARRPSI